MAKKKEEFGVSSSFSDAHLADICALKRDEVTWENIVKRLNKKYKVEKGREAYRSAYRSYSHLFEMEDKEVFIKKLQEIARTKKTSSKNAKENRKIIEELNGKEDILEEIASMIKSLPKQKIKLPKRIKKKGKKSMTKELMLSDIHFGKKTDTFNLEVCRRRLQELTKILIEDIERDSKSYNVERIVIALLGDIVESEMHGVESYRGLEFGLARQMAESINSLFLDVIKPIAMLGAKIDCVAVCGNHDRIDHKRTYSDPGLNNISYTIYKSLELLCSQAGFKNITFHIPVGPYVLLDIYGTNVLFEHGDNVKGNNRQSFETFMAKRSAQLKKIVSCIRVGHLHSYFCLGRGIIIQNASVCGKDSFSDVLGYSSEAGQTINTYVPTKKRPSSFFKSFAVDLEQVS